VRINHVDLLHLFELEPHGADTYVGVTVEYPWGPRLYGGQVVAQALRAAAATVETGRLVHSLHAYFIRPGAHTEPVRFEVERLRDGRSFSTRQVVARQSSGAILNASLSFQVPEDEVDVAGAVLPTGLPGPDDSSMSDQGWGAVLDRRSPVDAANGPNGSWIRARTDVGHDPVLQACAMAFISDAAPSRPARRPHPDFAGDETDRGLFRGASLDHSLWFHRASRADEWHWFASRSHGLSGARGLATADVVSQSGVHVATMAQQVLLRRLRTR
jgi:acyl-CoA thioesterase-2